MRQKSVYEAKTETTKKKEPKLQYRRPNLNSSPTPKPPPPLHLALQTERDVF